MAFTGVEHLANRQMYRLSGGERQCVLIARAICQEPQIILLDEPTASLDLAHQVRVMDLDESSWVAGFARSWNGRLSAAERRRSAERHELDWLRGQR